jgi:MoxR-like ATPase
MINSQTANLTIAQVAELAVQITTKVEKAVVGKGDLLRKMLAAFLSPGGHVLLEDFPGLAKTLIANSFAAVLGMDFKRIQFTPDLLPGDITGGYIFDSRENQFVLRKGPLVTQILLADEINRASPKTQSALLEAMQEYQVTLEGESLHLPEPFIVIATQNPIEYEGTFPLPEAQIDRFIVRLPVGYPSLEDEQEILLRRIHRKEDRTALEPVVSTAVFMQMRAAVEEVFVEPDLLRYIVQLVEKTRHHRQVELGASPRGSLALLKLARAWAAMHGRDYVLPDDIKEFAMPALGHRIILDPNLWGTKKAEQNVIKDVLQAVPVPVRAAQA